MPKSSRDQMIDRCCGCIQLLSTRKMSTSSLAQEMNFSIQTARRYIDGISLHFPVVSEVIQGHTQHAVEVFKIQSLVNTDKLKKDIKQEFGRIIDERL